MSIVQAYKSDHDGKLFEDKTKYIKHLRSLAAKNLHQKRLKKMAPERVKVLELMGQVRSIDELNQFIKDNWKWFWANGAKHESWRAAENPGVHEYVDVSISNVRWCEKLRNSHSAPRGGVQNFDTKSPYNQGRPTGYPGWKGRLVIKVRPPMRKYRGKPCMDDGWGSSYFSYTIIHTGSGGGGTGDNCKSYEYDVTLWAADFPVMYDIVRRTQYVHEENERRQKAWNMLGGTSPVVQVTEVPTGWVCPDPMTAIEGHREYNW